MENVNVLGRTHNEPEGGLDAVKIRQESQRRTLEESNKGHIDRYNELTTGYTKFAGMDFGVRDEAQAENVTDFLKQMQTERIAQEAQHKAEKEPYLNGGRVVDTFFKVMIEDLKHKHATLNSHLSGYHREKERLERIERERVEREAREAEQKARQEAEEAAADVETEADLDEAVTSERIVEDKVADTAVATKAASQNAAELSRTRTGYGSTSSLQTTWTHDEDAVSRGAIDLEALRPYLTMNAISQGIRGYIKAMGPKRLRELEKEGKTILRGCRIYSRRDSRVR